MIIVVNAVLQCLKLMLAFAFCAEWVSCIFIEELGACKVFVRVHFNLFNKDVWHTLLAKLDL